MSAEAKGGIIAISLIILFFGILVTASTADDIRRWTKVNEECYVLEDKVRSAWFYPGESYNELTMYCQKGETYRVPPQPD